MTGKDVSLFVGSFADQLKSLGVENVVISPGSRSTPLAIVFDRCGMDVTVDIDERGAAFYALGIAKAKGKPVCLICTSGTAVSNYFPAICEAQVSEVPLVVLTSDRPHELRNLSAPQTMDQIKIYGDKVLFFNEMPVPSSEPAVLRYARQIATEAFAHSTGVPCGPVHINFPFREPLMPDLSEKNMFVSKKRTVALCQDYEIRPAPGFEKKVTDLLAGRKTVIICGEGEYPEDMVMFAESTGCPILADPLSNLRRIDSDAVIGNYDSVLRNEDHPTIEGIIRFGRYPVSKTLFKLIERTNPLQVIVSRNDTKDFNSCTDIFVRSSVEGFIRGDWHGISPSDYRKEWSDAEGRADERIRSVENEEMLFEGSCISELLDIIPRDSLLFSANSMSIRYLDTFLRVPSPDIHIMCNRGLNGIDGTLSTALGASGSYEHTVLITGDLAFLHDINALQFSKHIGSQITVILFDNNGGGIFEMLPQRSDDAYFEKLFITPQDIEYGPICEGFGARYTEADSIEVFRRSYEESLGHRGISVIDVKVPIDSVSTVYRKYV